MTSRATGPVGRLIVAIVVVSLTLLLIGLDGEPVPANAATLRPYNVVIILTDDQRWDTVTRTFTPNVVTGLARSPGARRFKNAFVPNPLCCPSRASILTGRYSHSTGVWANHPPEGGFAVFDDSDTIAVDLDGAGYRTAMIGKYLNGYASGWSTYVPPGWDRWFAINTGRFYDYSATTQRGTHPHFGSAPEDYSTRVLGKRAKRFVSTASRHGVPFFLYLSYAAPHLDAIPARQDVGRFPPSKYPVPKPPSFNLVNSGDPDYVRRQARAHPALIRQNQLESTYSVDRSIGHLLEVLPPHTIVVFMSDNGYLWGEHRWISKRVPYNESLRIPLAVTSLDGTYTPTWGTRAITLNIDLRPSLQAAVGVPLGRPVDGQDWSSDPPRSDFVIERGEEPDGRIPSYCGVRELDWMYVRYSTGEEGLYNEVADPYEIDNLVRGIGAHPALQARRDELRARAEALCSPPPPDYSW